MADLERFQAGFKLNEKQRRYLEAARWFRVEDPRGEGRTVLQAYVIIEEALKNPGERVLIGADHSAAKNRVLVSTQLLPEVIRRILRTHSLGDLNERSDVTGEYLRIFPWVCGICQYLESDHVPNKPAPSAVTQLKCPFASTFFGKAFVGSKAANGTWKRYLAKEREPAYNGPTWTDGEKNDSRDL